MRLRVPLLLLFLSLATVASARPNRPATTAADETQSYSAFIPLAADNLCGPSVETFDDPASGWFVGQSADLSAEIDGGEYRLRFATPGAVWLIPGPLCLRTDYSAAVDAYWGGITGNFIGLLFGIDDDRQRAYLFAVNTDARMWMVFEVRPGDLRPIIEPTRDDAVRPGLEVNRLAVARSGETITLSVNGTVVGQLDGLGPGAPVLAGVAAAAYTDQHQTDARFDNFAWSGNQ